MARYQILYWRHIPLGVKATDVAGTIRKNLPARFQEMFQEAAAHSKKGDTGPFTTSGFRWADELEREGSAETVAAEVIDELIESWNLEESLTAFKEQKSSGDTTFIDLKQLQQV